MNFNPDSKVIVQGIVESMAAVYVPLMQAYGTQIVAGVSPGYGGQTLGDVPIFDLVEQAIAVVGSSVSTVDATVIFSPPYRVLDAALEAIAAGIRQVVLISQGVPPLDMVQLIRRAEAMDTLIIGPNSPGIIVPGQVLLGIHPPDFYQPGPIALLSRNVTLTYEVARTLGRSGLGQSMVVSIGGDPIVGSTFSQWLQILEAHEPTQMIVLLGEIGGDHEEAAAQQIQQTIHKPVIAYVAGRSAPRGRRIGHAGAIIDAQVTDFGPDIGTVESKVAALKSVGVTIADRPSEIPGLIRGVSESSLHKSV